MAKTIVAKISEGLGNQFFMYANAYAISKKFGLNFYIDPYSGYYKKNVRNFLLNNFNISSYIAPSEWIFSNNYRDLLKKVNIFFDKFKSNKSFLFEKKNSNKLTEFSPLILENTNDTIYIDGNFESEKYFSDYRNDLLNEFSFKNNFNYNNNGYINTIKNQNVVSITIRQNRFSERINNKHEVHSIMKSDLFVEKTVDYVYKSIKYFKSKIDNPKFFLWSNDFTNLEKFFPINEFQYVKNIENKILNDFYLLTQCKYFIVGPSTFSWWGAWLSNKQNKICVRPSNINPSNNSDFWPDSWTPI